MSSLKLNYEACVRSLSLKAGCEACQSACPEGAIALNGVRDTVVVHLKQCTDCGLCAAACPTDAFDAPFDVAAFVAASGPELRCGEGGLPCIGALSTEDLIVLACRHRELQVHDGPCDSRDPGHLLAHQRVQEVLRFIEDSSVRSRVQWVADEQLGAPRPAPPSTTSPPPAPERVSSGRRRLIGMFVPPLNETKSAELVHPDRLDRTRMQQVPRRRRRMLAALPPSIEARSPSRAQEQVSFYSTKQLSAEACTACSVCVAVCPTGALQAPRSLREIRFDTSRCTKCGLCHDVCDPDAITLAPETSLADLLDFGPRMLSRLAVASCAECGVRFRKLRPDQGLCERCEDMNREALELAGGGR